MKHAIGYLGRYERSFRSLRPGVRGYLRADGTFGEVDECPHDVDGVFFGFMEAAGRNFLAVRAQHGSTDLVLKTPVLLIPEIHTDGKGCGPRISRFGDESAQRLLADLIAENPEQASELRGIAEKLGWEELAPKPVGTNSGGPVNHEQRAAGIWEVLVAKAAAKETITYGQLASAVGIHHRALSRPLGLIQDYCLKTDLAPLTSIVVHSGDGKPGEGFIAYDVDKLPNGQALVYEEEWSRTPNPFGYAIHGETASHLAKRLIEDPASSAEVYQLVKVRGQAQSIFRQALLDAYGWGCAFCGLTFTEALDAAHIYPWAKSTRSQRMNVRNGLLLCSNHHRMFDNDWITLTEELLILYSDVALHAGPYTPMDKRFGPDLHQQRLRLPVRKEHWPDCELIRKRYSDH